MKNTTDIFGLNKSVIPVPHPGMNFILFGLIKHSFWFTLFTKDTSISKEYYNIFL
jgi:hypothetical protein